MCLCSLVKIAGLISQTISDVRKMVKIGLVANYQLHLPDKKLLEDKLRELTEIAGNQESEDDAED